MVVYTIVMLIIRRCYAFLWVGILSAVACVCAERVGYTASIGAALHKFEEGTRLYTAGRFSDALRAFAASMELEPSPNTRFKIAKCYLALAKTASAYINFKRTAQEAQDRADATGELRYLPTRNAALVEANALESQVPKLMLVVPSDIPEGFTLSVDGNPLPHSAWGIGIETDPGPHAIVASGPRLKRYSQSIELHEGEYKRLDIPILRLTAAIATVRLVFALKPAGMAVSLDGQPVSPEQFEQPQFVEGGSHKVVVSAPGYANFLWKKLLQDNDAVLVPVALEAQTGTSRVPKLAVFIVGGATLAALAVGIGFGVKAQLAANDQMALDPLQRPATIQDSIRTDAIVANVFFGVSGALALTTTILAATTKWRGGHTEPKRPVTAFDNLNIFPAMTSEKATLQMSGRF